MHLYWYSEANNSIHKHNPHCIAKQMTKSGMLMPISSLPNHYIRTRHRIQIFTIFLYHIGVPHFYSTIIQLYILVTWDQSGSTLWYDEIRICWHLQHSYKLLFAAVSTTGPGKCWNFKRNIVTDRLILDIFCKSRWTSSSYKGDQLVQRFLAYDQDLLNGPAYMKTGSGITIFQFCIWSGL